VQAVEAAEAGVDYLTFRQAERLADAYERPVAALFAPSVPEEELPEAQFRRLPGAQPPPWPPELRTFIRRVREHQAETVELLELLDEEPAWPHAHISFVDDPDVLAAEVRNALGVKPAVQKGWWREKDYTHYTPLRGWVDAVERLGVLVMQNGDVGRALGRAYPSLEGPQTLPLPATYASRSERRSMILVLRPPWRGSFPSLTRSWMVERARLRYSAACSDVSHGSSACVASAAASFSSTTRSMNASSPSIVTCMVRATFRKRPAEMTCGWKRLRASPSAQAVSDVALDHIVDERVRRARANRVYD
jgi:hypothetical protein